MLPARLGSLPIAMVVSTAVLVVSSSSAQATDADLRAVARDVCACLEEPQAKIAELAETLKAAQASGDFEKLMGLRGEMGSVADASDACFDELEKKYPKIAENEEKIEAVNAITEEICPNPTVDLMP